MEIVVRASATFVFLWLLTRAMGKRTLAEITPFELVLLIIMGDLVQQGVTQEDMSTTGGILAVGTIALLIAATSYVSFRWKPTRPLIEGRPVIVIRDGEVVHETLRIERMTVDEVMDGARENGIGDLREIRIGILEADGRFSFIKMPAEAGESRGP